MDAIKSLIQNSDGLGFAISTIALIYTIYSSRSTSSRQIADERHKKLISPMFSLLEPYLFQNIDKHVLEKVLNLTHQNKSLVDGKLLEVTHYCSENPSQPNYDALCSYINKTYDKSCRLMGLELRSIEYRLNRKQYKSKASLAFYLAIIAGRAALTFLAMFFGTLLFLSIGVYWFENIMFPGNQIKALLFIGIILFILLNHSENKY